MQIPLKKIFSSQTLAGDFTYLCLWTHRINICILKHQCANISYYESHQLDSFFLKKGGIGLLISTCQPYRHFWWCFLDTVHHLCSKMEILFEHEEIVCLLYTTSNRITWEIRTAVYKLIKFYCLHSIYSGQMENLWLELMGILPVV